MNNNLLLSIEREFQLNEMDEENRRLICAELAEIIADKMYLTISQHLSVLECKQFDSLLAQSGSEDLISEFFHEKLPEYSKIMHNIVDELKRKIVTLSME